MKYLHHILLALLLLSLVTSCTKYVPCDDDDPNCTYFVCKVDGKKWTPSCEGDGIFGCSATDVQYYRQYDDYHIYLLIENDDKNSAMKVRAKNAKKTNETYPLATLGTIPSFYADGATVDRCSTHDIDYSKSHYLRLNEIDTINYIVGGEFEFTGQDSCGKVVQITEGKFRLRYRF